MQYRQESLEELARGLDEIPSQLQQLQMDCLLSCSDIPNERVKEYMFHGAGRRLNVLRHTIINVFAHFPPSAEEKLDRETLFDVQINLQAFFINLVGVFDNWAWSFVHLHQLEADVGGRLNVDMFKGRIQRLLPQALQQHLQSEAMVRWHLEYLKNYRDALAHRIPLYIPPATLTPAEQEHYDALEAQRFGLIQAHQWQQLGEMIAEQDALGRPCFAFLHSFSEDQALRPILIHPQMLSDASTVIEFGNLFLAHWRERAQIIPADVPAHR